MNKLVLGVVLGLAGFAGATAAQSADLPKMVLKAPPAALPGDWTGFYVGVQAGGGWGHAKQTDPSPFDTGWYNTSGALAGVTWGYNWQVGHGVIGFESDAAWSNVRGSTIGTGIGGTCGGTSPRCESELQAFGTTRLRLGYALGSWLPFVSGGMAWGYVHGEEGDTPAGGPNGSGAEFHYGWTVGGGVEKRLTPHWSAKAEYLYADLRGGMAFVDQIGTTRVDQAVPMQVHIVRAGLNYKFDAGPALMSYLPPSAGPSAGPWSWNGLYAGLNYGGGAGRASQSDAVFDRGHYDVSGGIVGGTLGYNWQRERWVYGVEADMDYSSIKGATGGISDFVTPPCNSVAGGFANCDTKLRWLGTARARVGVAWDRLLPYVTAGVAVGSLRSSEGAGSALLSGSGTVTRVGWTAGAGVEARIDDRWSAKLEYLYVDLGSGEGFTDIFPAGTTVSETTTFNTHILRSGLNYRFN